MNGRADELVTCNLGHFAQEAARFRLRLARPGAWAALPSIEEALRVVQIIRLAPDSKGDSRPVSGRSLPLAATSAMPHCGQRQCSTDENGRLSHQTLFD